MSVVVSVPALVFVLVFVFVFSSPTSFCVLSTVIDKSADNSSDLSVVDVPPDKLVASAISPETDIAFSKFPSAIPDFPSA